MSQWGVTRTTSSGGLSRPVECGQRVRTSQAADARGYFIFSVEPGILNIVSKFFITCLFENRGRQRNVGRTRRAIGACKAYRTAGPPRSSAPGRCCRIEVGIALAAEAAAAKALATGQFDILVAQPRHQNRAATIGLGDRIDAGSRRRADQRFDAGEQFLKFRIGQVNHLGHRVPAS